jgi:prepilin-type N-terminal cleavage/methylation domain-containing protein
MKKGFTLVELIIVVTIVMLLGTIAVGMYFNTMRNFVYFTNLKNFESVFRTARSFAITNASLGGESPNRFGVLLEENKNDYHIRMFADFFNEYQFDKGDDAINISKDYILPKDKFKIEIFQGKDLSTALTFPFAFYYEKVDGDFKAFKSDPPDEATIPIEKSAKNYIDIKISSLENTILVRHLVINQVSGLPEEYKSL